MTIEELHDEISPVLKDMDRKLDSLTAQVVKHDVNIETVNREAKEQKAESKRLDDRISKIEKFMWMMLGAGGASGIGIAKLFL